MPPLVDRARIRAILEVDRPWGAYALADLEPGFFEATTWFAPAPGGPARGEEQTLLLLYRGFRIPVMLALGSPRDVEPLLDEAERALAGTPERFFVARHELRSLFEERHRLPDPAPMLRMLLDPRAFHPVEARADFVVPLGPADLDDLRALYADGEAAGEAPEFFTGDMLAQGTYHGVREGGVLVAAAGTHVFAPGMGVGAIGNVYTRRDRRGCGLGSVVTAAVVGQLVGLGLETLVLNVNEANSAAIRVYGRLGFRTYCRFLEGPAVVR